MFKLIIKHETRKVLASAKTWFSLALIQAILGMLYKWLLSKYTQQLQAGQNLDGINLGFTEEVIHPFFAWFALICLFITPIIAMHSICGERQRNTLILYLTSSSSTLSLVTGKFFTYSIILTVLMLLSSLMPLSVIIGGNIDWGHFCSLWLGVWLMLHAALAISIMISSFGSHPVTTTVTIYFCLFALILIEWGAYFIGDIGIFVKQFGFLYPIKLLLAGIISAPSMAYYLGIIIACLLISRYSLGKELCHY